MSEWAYVAIAYTVAWGGLAVYALALARRVTQARKVDAALKGAAETEQGEVACDDPSAP